MYIQKKLEYFNNAYAAWAKLNFRLIHLFWNNTIPRLYPDAWFLTTQVHILILSQKKKTPYSETTHIFLWLFEMSLDSYKTQLRSLESLNGTCPLKTET
jgi:hypothetical protein